MGDNGQTSVNSCGQRNPEWETSVGKKCGRQVEDKCRPRHPEWKTSVGNKCGRQVEDKCKLMRPKAPRVRDKRGRRETSVTSWGHGHPEWETSVADKWETTHAVQGTQSEKQE